MRARGSSQPTSADGDGIPLPSTGIPSASNLILYHTTYDIRHTTYVYIILYMFGTASTGWRDGTSFTTTTAATDPPQVPATPRKRGIY